MWRHCGVALGSLTGGGWPTMTRRPKMDDQIWEDGGALCVCFVRSQMSSMSFFHPDLFCGFVGKTNLRKDGIFCANQTIFLTHSARKIFWGLVRHLSNMT